jgi:hypothetical protein
MVYSLAQAATVVGKNRSTILRAIKLGNLSAERDEASGAWAIQPAELHRVYPVASAHDDQHAGQHVDASERNSAPSAEIHELRARLGVAEARLNDKDALIAAHERALDDLRRRLDAADEERRKLMLMLADHRTAPPVAPVAPPPVSPEPRRRWWRWR